MRRLKKRKKSSSRRRAIKLWNDSQMSRDLNKKNPKYYLRLHHKQLHREIMEVVLGRKLTPEEVVHHKDTNKLNCHPDNLVLCASRKEHLQKYHSTYANEDLIQKLKVLAKDPHTSRKVAAETFGISESLVKKMIKIYQINWIAKDEHSFSESEIQNLLKQHSTKEVAEIQGVHVGTLYRKFPKLFSSGKPRGFLEVYKACQEMDENGEDECKTRKIS